MVAGLPSCPELYRDSVPRTSDVGRLLCVVGTVVRISASKMLEYKKEFMCTKCKHVFTVEVCVYVFVCVCVCVYVCET